MKSSRKTLSGFRLAALSGALVFSGSASASTILSEDFEGGSPGIWSNGFGTYTTGQNFSGSSHGSIPGGGGIYAHMIGIPGTSTQTTIDLPSALSAAEQSAVAGGSAIWNSDVWLASWTSDADISILSGEWFAGLGGTGASLGISGFADGGNSSGVTQLINGATLEAGAANWNEDNWSRYVTSGSVPAGAQSLVFTYAGGTTGGSNTNDAYADSLSLSVNVPEPSAAVLFGIAGLTLLLRRTRCRQ